MLASRSFRIALAGVGLAVLAGVVWCAWLAWQVNRDLGDAVDHASAFQRAVEDGDAASTQRELAALEDASAAADEETSGFTWSVLEALPVVGDDARGVRTVSEVVHHLTADGLQSLVEVQDQLPDLLPDDGTVALDGIVGLQEPVATAETALREADEQLAEQDSSGFTGRLRDQYDDLYAQVSAASEAMTSARIATDLLPAMLGEEGDRKYLLVFQNNAEIRATGGLPGAVSLLHASDGTVEITRQVAGADFGRVAPPPLPLTDAERGLYDDVLGAYFLSSNMTPDLPRASDLWVARWNQVYPDDHVDGVLTLDTVALSYVLEATGPVTVDGIELTGDNVVDQLLHDVYLRIDDPKAQDAFFADVARTAFERFLAGTDNPTGMIRALARATDEGRMGVHFFDGAEQDRIAGTRIAGELVTDPDDPSPQVNVTVNDTTAAKMSYYLRYQTSIDATYCLHGVQGMTGKMRLTSVAPRSAAGLPAYITGPNGFTEPGNQLVTVRIYGPASGSIEGATLNDKPLKMLRVDQDGRPVGTFYIELSPGETSDVAWSMKSGPGQTATPDVRVTPSITAGAPTETQGAC